MLTIRLSRTGKRHKPQYRIVVQEKQHDPWSPAIEIIGTYNPHTEPNTIKFKEDRVKHWLEVGAQPSNTVHNMLVNAGMIEADKAKSVTISNKREKKMEDKKEEAEKKAQAQAKAKEDNPSENVKKTEDSTVNTKKESATENGEEKKEENPKKKK